MSAFASLYDGINGSAYPHYADFLCECFSKSEIPVREVLDLGCGTGGIASLLASRGYDMVGIDSSPDMLAQAYSRNAGSNTLLLCQDMRSFELYGTVQAVYSSFDCLNYIEGKDLASVFALVRNYLEPNGLFVFDVNTLSRYTAVFDGKSYVYEPDGNMLVWQSAFDRRKNECIFRLDSFSPCGKKEYVRESETQTQYFHSDAELVSAAEGFTVLSVTGGKGFDGCAESEKSYYIMRRDG